MNFVSIGPDFDLNISVEYFLSKVVNNSAQIGQQSLPITFDPMDFLNDYSDDEAPPQKETPKETVDDAVEGTVGEDTVEYEDFNEDVDDRTDNAPNEPSNNSDDDSDDEYGPKPADITEDISLLRGPVEEEERAVELTAEQKFDLHATKHQIPVAYEVSLGGHNKAVTTVSIEPAGNRLVTGSMDYSLKLYDFGGMDSRHRAFNSIEAQDGHPIVAISHSPSGDRFLVATASSQPKVFDRDGHEIIQFVKGDMYLRDLTHTKGHTMAVTDCQWHPVEKQFVATSSLDGTVRLWDLLGEAAFGKLCNIQVLKPTQDKSIVSSAYTGSQGSRTAVTSCVFTPNNGQRIYGGLSNGNIVGWQVQTSSTVAIRKHHYTPMPTVFSYPSWLIATYDGGSNSSSVGGRNSDRGVLSLVISPNEKYLAARYGNATVVIWDLSTRQPIAHCADLPCPLSYADTANVAFSPNSELFCVPALSADTEVDEAVDAPAASSSSKPEIKKKVSIPGKPRLYFFESVPSSSALRKAERQERIATAKPVLSIALGATGQVGIHVVWQRHTNQLFVTMSTGVTKVLYDPAMVPGNDDKARRKGAVLSAARAPKREKDPSDYAIVGEIINPMALPLYRKDNHPDAVRKRKVEQLKDPQIAKIPEKPSKKGPGTRENTSFFFTNYVMSAQQGEKKTDLRAEDPREALLKYADVTKNDPRFLGRAYAQTQPKNELAKESFEEEQEQFKKKQKTL